jgi:predicted kinase
MIYNRVLIIALIILCGCGRKASIIAAPDTVNQPPVLTREHLEEIYSEHTSQLSYTQIAQDPFVVTFSGVPGMGKSFISQELAEQFKAVRIRSDHVRDMLRKMAGVDKKDLQRALKEYFSYMLQRYDFPNRRIILDASIDRTYVTLFPYFEKHNIPFMVIRLDVPREIIVERIMQREGKYAPYYLRILDKSFEEYEEFGSKYKNYFLFKNGPGACLDAITDEVGHRLNAQIQE